MGIYLFDQFTLLHFSVGIIMYFWGINLFTWIIIHLLFEIFENSSYGMYFINNYLPIWPGNKPKSDTFINSFGDTIGGILGWLFARYIDRLGNKLNWYPLHLNKNII
tara:strand:- start:7 stop:327 length:321 start_codon:yes stop_codon:yes gene_type:complete